VAAALWLVCFITLGDICLLAFCKCLYRVPVLLRLQHNPLCLAAQHALPDVQMHKVFWMLQCAVYANCRPLMCIAGAAVAALMRVHCQCVCDVVPASSCLLGVCLQRVCVVMLSIGNACICQEASVPAFITTSTAATGRQLESMGDLPAFCSSRSSNLLVPAGILTVSWCSWPVGPEIICLSALTVGWGGGWGIFEDDAVGRALCVHSSVV
jgi:hypothetical protein